ncbi:MAG: hypothetical protein M3N17_03325 [Actinomycetota bacterium]|nr:hypothetical protein [Actinomycetota bacterium]
MTKLSRDGSALVYSTFVGTAGFEGGADIAVDPAGDAYITGQTESGAFPTTPAAYDPTYNGGTDAFVAKLETRRRR